MSVIYSYKNKKELFQKAATFITRKANKAIADKGYFSIALSGGSTPNELYALILSEFADNTDWKKVYFFWSDERYVPANDEQNNSFQAFNAMLNQLNTDEKNIFPIPVELPIEVSSENYEKKIKEILGEQPVFDIVMLGLGTDGHTASLFPKTKGLNEEKSLVIAVTDKGQQPQRISFTYPLINNAENVMFLVTGESKREVLGKILHGTETEKQAYPASRIIPVNGKLYWFTDEEANPPST